MLVSAIGEDGPSAVGIDQACKEEVCEVGLVCSHVVGPCCHVCFVQELIKYGFLTSPGIISFTRLLSTSTQMSRWHHTVLL